MASNKKGISGLSVYKDKLGRDVHYDRLTKKAYFIPAKKLNQYNVYSRRFFFPIIAFILVYTFKIQDEMIGFKGAIIAAIAISAIVEAFYRFIFLQTLPPVKGFKPEKQDDYFSQLANTANQSDLMIRGVLYLALAGLLVVFGFISQFETLEWILCIVVALFAVGMAIVNLIAISRK